MNQRKKLIARLRRSPDVILKQRLKNINVEIKNHFYDRKRNNARRNIIPRNAKSLRKAVHEQRM